MDAYVEYAVVLFEWRSSSAFLEAVLTHVTLYSTDIGVFSYTVSITITLITFEERTGKTVFRKLQFYTAISVKKLLK